MPDYADIGRSKPAPNLPIPEKYRALIEQIELLEDRHRNRLHVTLLVYVGDGTVKVMDSGQPIKRISLSPYPD